jgi:hypothetical protein
MSFLLRRTRKAAWVGEARRREDAVGEFARSEQDTDGLSVFEVDNAEQRAMVVAAFACERLKTDRIDFIEVERATLERYGEVAKTPERGTMAVATVNALHCSLDWDPSRLRRLAEDLFDQGHAPAEVRRDEVRAALRLIDAEAVVGDEARAFVRAEQARGRS